MITGAGISNKGGSDRCAEIEILCIQYIYGIGNPMGVNHKADILVSGGYYHIAAIIYEVLLTQKGRGEVIIVE